MKNRIIKTITFIGILVPCLIYIVPHAFTFSLERGRKFITARHVTYRSTAVVTFPTSIAEFTTHFFPRKAQSFVKTFQDSKGIQSQEASAQITADIRWLSGSVAFHVDSTNTVVALEIADAVASSFVARTSADFAVTPIISRHARVTFTPRETSGLRLIVVYGYAGLLWGICLATLVAYAGFKALCTFATRLT